MTNRLRWQKVGDKLMAWGLLTHKIFKGSVTRKFHASSGLETSMHDTQQEAMKWCMENETRMHT